MALLLIALHNSSPPFTFVISFGTFIYWLYLGYGQKSNLTPKYPFCLWSNHSLQQSLTSGLHDLTRSLRWKCPHSQKTMNYCALNRKKRVCSGIYVQLYRTNVIQNCGTCTRISYGTWERIHSRVCFWTRKPMKNIVDELFLENKKYLSVSIKFGIKYGRNP